MNQNKDQNFSILKDYQYVFLEKIIFLSVLNLIIPSNLVIECNITWQMFSMEIIRLSIKIF